MTMRLISALAAVAMLALGLTCVAPAAESVSGDAASGNATDPAWWASQIGASGFKAAKPKQEWWRAVVAQNPSCPVVSDGCQTCFAGEDSFTCSNPGIACIAGERWVCATGK